MNGSHSRCASITARVQAVQETELVPRGSLCSRCRVVPATVWCCAAPCAVVVTDIQQAPHRCCGTRIRRDRPGAPCGCCVWPESLLRLQRRLTRWLQSPARSACASGSRGAMACFVYYHALRLLTSTYHNKHVRSNDCYDVYKKHRRSSCKWNIFAIGKATAIPYPGARGRWVAGKWVSD